MTMPLTDEQSINLHFGRRLYLLRQRRRMSLKDVGDALGLTYQQIRKYETGKSRISAVGLLRLSAVLDVDTSYFFDGLDAGRSAAAAPHPTAGDEGPVSIDAIPDPAIKSLLKTLIIRLGAP